MSEGIKISKDKPEFPSMDFEFLKTRGIEKIQELAKDTWTDHNVHDPGITILEQLCYAITDLGHRTNLDIKDILSCGEPIDPVTHAFFTPRQILPSSALTYDDFRRLSIDCPGVRNAWFVKSRKHEQDLYYNSDKKELGYADGERIRLSGTYDVQLEFETGEDEEDLNNNIIRWQQRLKLPGSDQEFQLEVEFPFWDQLPLFWSRDFTLETIFFDPEWEKNQSYDFGDRYDYRLIFEINDKSNDRLRTKIKVEKILSDGQTADLEAGDDKEKYQKTIVDALTDPSSNGLMDFFRRKTLLAYELAAKVKEKLHNHRNLCEDFHRYSGIRVQEIGVKTDIDIVPGADPNTVLSEIYSKLKTLFSPDIRFYNLQEMLDQEKPVEEIFEGPLLDHGFLRKEDLALLDRQEEIYTSDIISLIMDVEDVLAVKNLTISNYVFNEALNKGVKNCLKLAAVNSYQPKLGIDYCDIQLFKNEKPVPLSESTKEPTALKLPEPKPLRYTGNAKDISIPLGKNPDLEDYSSIQNQFPSTYGIGPEGLPNPSSIERKARVNQLKGYLLVFDQLMANYLSQLSHIKNLFSLDTAIKTTSHVQPVLETTRSEHLVKSGYKQTLKTISKSDFHTRRNLFLDHLAAKFSEDFSTYSRLMDIHQEEQASEQLMYDKIGFIKNFPDVSLNRGNGINFNLFTSGSTASLLTHSAGIENRIAYLLGIKDSNLVENQGQIRVIEHTILRPKVYAYVDDKLVSDDLLKPVYAAKHKTQPQLTDPYSFRTTVLLPTWVLKFKKSSGDQNEFRDYAESRVRSELPAHIISKIYWVGQQTMTDFDKAFQEWLVLNAKEEPVDETQREAYTIKLSKALNAVIFQLKKIRKE